MIIVDLSQIMISNLMIQINGRNAPELSEDLVRHMVLNSLRGHNRKFRDKYGEMVLAADSGNVWRKQSIPQLQSKSVKKQDEINQTMIGLLSLRY